MFIVSSYGLAIALCVVTMLCWGSWGNSQLLANPDKKWRYELFYWDYVFGVFVAALIFANTLGSNGDVGRSFTNDLSQAAPAALGWALAGGAVFNLANILLVAAIDVAGMAVAFPVGIGLALVLGVFWNYLKDPAASGNSALLFLGVALVAAAIVTSALSYRKRDAALAAANAEKKPIGKGLTLAVLCGVLMSLFSFFVNKSMAAVVFPNPDPSAANAFLSDPSWTLSDLRAERAGMEIGKLTAYTANVVFALGVLLSNFVIMPILMRKPFVGEPVSMGAYWKGTFRNHFWGWIGGAVWAVGMTMNVVSYSEASPAIAYGLGQGATLVSAIWGVFIWREFKGSPKGVGKMLAAMFVFFVVGLGLIIGAKGFGRAEKAPYPTAEVAAAIEEVAPAAVEETAPAAEVPAAVEETAPAAEVPAAIEEAAPAAEEPAAIEEAAPAVEEPAAN